MTETRIITLTTDFGQVDGYVGTMKGVILARAPQARWSISAHAASRRRTSAAGAFVLYRAFATFPGATVHLAVVDPGVGERPPGAAAGHGGPGGSSGPDNGLFTYVLRVAVARAVGPWPERADAPAAVWDPAFDLAAALAAPTRPACRRPTRWRPGLLADRPQRHVPRTGRVRARRRAPRRRACRPRGSARLSPSPSSARLPDVTPAVTADAIQGRIIAAGPLRQSDHQYRRRGYWSRLGPPPQSAGYGRPASPAGHRADLCRRAPGAPLALINSAGLLEIAVREGQAGQQLGLGVGTPVVCQIAPAAP